MEFFAQNGAAIIAHIPKPRPQNFKSSFATLNSMSYECRNLRETFCVKRNKECDPGAPGCVLRGRFVFPFSASAQGRGSAQPANKKQREFLEKEYKK